MTRKLCSFASFAQAIQASLRHSRDSTAVGIPRSDSDEESADPRIGQDNKCSGNGRFPVQALLGRGCSRTTDSACMGTGTLQTRANEGSLGSLVTPELFADIRRKPLTTAFHHMKAILL